MANLLLKNGYVTIQDEEIPSGMQVAVYQGTTPDMSLANKVYLGTFAKENLSFLPPEDFAEQRYFYLYQFGDKQKLIAQRVLPLEGTFNCRDLGGYPTKDGRYTKWGLLYRSDALNNLTAKDVRYLEEVIGLKSIVDFRSYTEIEAAPDQRIPGVTHYYLNPNADIAALATGNLVDDQEKIHKLVAIAKTPEGEEYFASRLEEMAEQMRELVATKIANQRYREYLELLLSGEKTPLLEHCKGGKDRAGFAAILILLCLGVEESAIYEDYMLTKEMMATRNEKRMAEYRQYTDNPQVLTYLSGLMQTKKLYIDAAFEEMRKLADNPEQYLEKVMKMTSEELTRLREYYLDSGVASSLETVKTS
ncbi:tyrosine-protein phosphatase [Enterococcus asini]|uniref:tyrosine-protein phosphatase n=1 Tax=Enterococcus asini TaxID=57732 RepID=UPI00288D3943|nr:tyrosine-protein phosphatase [Enterococcus asini]MDT2757613.1 tyrosine-protein phosphatase [Enterococcus asini]